MITKSHVPGDKEYCEGKRYRSDEVYCLDEERARESAKDKIVRHKKERKGPIHVSHGEQRETQSLPSY